MYNKRPFSVDTVGIKLDLALVVALFLCPLCSLMLLLPAEKKWIVASFNHCTITLIGFRDDCLLLSEQREIRPPVNYPNIRFRLIKAAAAAVNCSPTLALTFERSIVAV